MTVKKTIGAALIASPFIAMAALIYMAGGVSAVLGIFGTVVVVVAIIFGGVVMVTDD